MLKERYTEGMSLSAALAAALAALAGQGNGDASEVNASQLEVAVLMRGREHRAFRRLTGRPARGAAAQQGEGLRTAAGQARGGGARRAGPG